MTRTSVVIATRDRPTQLASCLDALAGSFPQDAEAIVVADGGAVSSAVEPFVDALRLRVISTPSKGPAGARNSGLAAARGEIVAFTDDDCVPRRGWLESLAAGVRLSPPRAAGGTTRNGLPANPYADVAQLILDLVAQHERATYGGEQFFPANNIAFPTVALRELGGFDESYRTAEDRELCRRWLEAGFELGRVHDAVLEHHPRLDFAAFVRQFHSYGRGAARFHSCHDGSLRASAAFHVRLPRLLAPVIASRDVARGAQVAALVGLWEVASLAGYVTGEPR